MLILERPWTQQPVDTRDVEGIDAVAVWNAAAGPVDLRRRQMGQYIDGAVTRVSQIGQVMSTTGGTNAANVPRLALPTDSSAALFRGKPTTLLMQLYPTELGTGLGVIASMGLPSQSRCLFLIRAVSGTTAFELACNNGNWSSAIFAGAALSNNTIYTLALLYDGAYVALVVNGTAYAPVALAGSAFPAAASVDPMYVGAGNASTGSNNFWGAVAQYSLFIAARGNIGIGRAIDLTRSPASPWQLFAPRRIPIPTPAAAAVPTLSASTYVPGSMTSTGWRPQITAS